MAAAVVADVGDIVGSVEVVVCFGQCRSSIKGIYAGLYGLRSVLSCSARWILDLLLLSLLLSVAASVVGRKRPYASYALVYIDGWKRSCALSFCAVLRR